MWIAKLNNGTIITQSKNEPSQFSEIKHLISSLGYKYHDSEVWLPDGLLDYRYGGSASSSLGDNPEVDSYWIQGTFHSDFRKIRIRFDNSVRKITVEDVK